MTIAQIQYFIAVAKNLNYSNAAKTLYISQPVLSRRIADLEAELGFALFERDSHSVRLTPAGSIMYDCLKKCSEEFDAALHSAAQEHERTAGNITLGLLDFLDEIGIDVLNILNDFKVKYPHTTLHIYQQAQQFWPEMVLMGDYDLIFTFSDMLPESEDIDFIPLVNVSRKLCYAPKYLPAGKIPSLQDFSAATIYAAEHTDIALARKRLTKLLSQYGIRRPKIVFLPTTSAVFASVGSGLGVTVADTAVVDNYSADLCELELGTHTLGILCRADESDSRIDFLRRRFSRIQPPKQGALLASGAPD